MTLILLLLSACTPPDSARVPAPEPPEALVTTEAPWQLVHEGADSLAVRYGDSPDGVRVQLIATEDWRIGATPIVGGRPVRVGAYPLVGVPFEPQTVEVRSEGPDLLVRFSGPPLRELATRPDAPDDPALAWIRLRPRGETWRVVLDGLGTIQVPDVERVEWTSAGLAIGSRVVLTTTAKAQSSRVIPGGWQLDTSPGLEAADPYPRTALTLTP